MAAVDIMYAFHVRVLINCLEKWQQVWISYQILSWFLLIGFVIVIDLPRVVLVREVRNLAQLMLI